LFGCILSTLNKDVMMMMMNTTLPIGLPSMHGFYDCFSILESPSFFLLQISSCNFSCGRRCLLVSISAHDIVSYGIYARRCFDCWHLSHRPVATMTSQKPLSLHSFNASFWKHLVLLISKTAAKEWQQFSVLIYCEPPLKLFQAFAE